MPPPPPPWSLQAWVTYIAFILAATLAHSSASTAILSPDQTTALVSVPICRFVSRPCVRLADRNSSEIIAPLTSVPLYGQYAIYSPLTEASTCPTNHTTCVPSSAYVPALSRLPNGAINLTFSLLDADLVADSSLIFTLSSSAFLHGPPCGSGVCNATMWSIPCPPSSSSPVVTFVISNATGLVNVSRTGRIALSSMPLVDTAVAPASIAGFAPTVSFESDPTCMRLSIYLPRTLAISSLSLCLALNSQLCPYTLPSSFQSLPSNATKATILQGSASVRVNLTNASNVSMCMTLAWDPSDVAALQIPLGLSLSSVRLANSSTGPSSPSMTLGLPSSMLWTIEGTDAQCVPIVYLDSPRSADVLEPKTLWTVVSLVLYTFGVVLACLLVRLHGLAFVKTSMFNDIALVSVLLVFLCSLFLHVLWLTILHRLPGSSGIEAGFLVAILEGLRETVLWTFLVSICAHWMVLSWPFIARHHRDTGHVVAAWCGGLVVHFLVLLLYVVQNYNVMKCTYVDYLRNSHQRHSDGGAKTATSVNSTNSTLQLWLPLLQPADWKYGVEKVCVDSGGGFLYTFAPLHILPLGVLMLLLRLGCSRLQWRQSKTPLYGSDHVPLTASESHNSVMPPRVSPTTPHPHQPLHRGIAKDWMLTGTSATIMVALVTTLGLHHGLTLYLYATNQHMPALVWLVVGEYLPMLVPTLGYLALQWTAQDMPSPMPLDRQSSRLPHHRTPPHPSKRYNRIGLDQIDDGEDQGLLPLTPSPTSASAVPFGERHPTLAHLNVTMEKSLDQHPVIVQLFVSHVSDLHSWTPVGEALNGQEQPTRHVTTPWRPHARLRCVVATPSSTGERIVDSEWAMDSLLHTGRLLVQAPSSVETDAVMPNEEASSSPPWLVSISLDRLENTISKPLAIALTTNDESTLQVTEVLRESPWSTVAAIAYVQTVVPAVQSMAEQAAADLAAFDAAHGRTRTVLPIDQIQEAAEADKVRSWLVQRHQKRMAYATMLTTECLPAMADRRDTGAWAKLTIDAKSSALRYLVLNMHVHELHVETGGAKPRVYSTLTSGVLASHSATKLPPLSCAVDDDGPSLWPAHVRYTDEAAWSAWMRETEANGQALATLVTAVVDQMNKSGIVSTWVEWVVRKSFVLHMESLLSDYGKERHMLHDCAAAMEWLQTHVTLGVQLDEDPDATDVVVNIKLYPSLHDSAVRTDDSVVARLGATKVHVVLCVAQRHWPSTAHLDDVVAVTALLFTQGINEAQTLANKTGGLFKETFPDAVNQRSLDRLAACVESNAGRLIPECAVVVRSKLASLTQSILQAKRERVKKKHPEILQVAAHITRLMGGGRITVCATGKERTAMAVTLEHGWLLGHFHHVPAPSVRRAIASMRSDGVRLDVLEKNGGKRQYSFSALQRSMVPEAYRCPEGTYDSTIA
ncbi:hypothetical protein H310_12194 [Aphanomyces invadans]|uniref:Uncharacterized protein n=1 Tax=Aphanomyces invadans TaxID=157072 RepID=A0A024TKI5_9STRA|nr:hypothetical protein H310_12194 [Aphanomyces invadans]ETV93842.1 hypothetical protein H310_12194 [Aphanomyces invadans]|eukprot:XP_008877402.1 hypothetical protein H310_12194 [Aphanomyces invadans]